MRWAYKVAVAASVEVVVVGAGAVVVGTGAVVVGRGAVVVGTGTVLGARGVLVGRGAVVVGTGAVVVGRGAVVVGRGAVVVGRGAVVVGRGAVVAGRGAVVAGRGAVVAGRGAVVATLGAVVVGRGRVVVAFGADRATAFTTTFAGAGAMVAGAGATVCQTVSTSSATASPASSSSTTAPGTSKNSGTQGSSGGSGGSSDTTTAGRAMGYRLKPLVQSGSNFGMAVAHDVPRLVRIGTGTMVSDGLKVLNAEYSSTSFRVRDVAVPGNTFTGNGISYPADAKLGEDCLLATRVLIPITGEVRSGVGLLGSPAFEIPRVVQRDREALSPTGAALDRALARKLRYNTATILLALLNRWVLACVFSLLMVFVVDVIPGSGTWALALLLFVMPAISAAIFIVAERATLGFRRLKPLHCSIYDPRFWQHERFWKLSEDRFKALFVGTPFISWVWRLLGVRVGRRLFDDGVAIIEKSMVTLGDDCTLNVGCIMQGHSLEEGSFKSDAIVLEDGVTLGTGSFVHYGTRVGAGAVIEADAFLMKGEEVPARQRWHGNPALPVRTAGPRAGVRTPVAAPPADEHALGDAGNTDDLLTSLEVPAPLSVAGVSVFLFDLAACAAREPEFLAALAPQQRAEAGRLASARARLQFVSSRALGVLLLGREVGPASGDGWWISSAAGGGPTVHGSDGDVPSISFSYTDELIAVALSATCAVGIDLTAEVTDRAITAAWALSKRERRTLAGVRKADRNWEFVKIWGVKEATAKCLGLGASMQFEAFDTTRGLRGIDDGPFRDVLYRGEELDFKQRRYWLAVASRPADAVASRPADAVASRRAGAVATRAARAPVRLRNR